MYQSSILTNVNAKRINHSTSTSRAAEAYEEPEFSYNDVLYDEMSRNMKRYKRNTSNNSRNSSNANTATTLNTSSKISTFSNPLAGLSLGGTSYSNYMPSLGATNASSSNPSRDEILDWLKELIDGKTKIEGDANGDGKVDLNDLKVMVDRMFDDNVDIKMKNVDFDGDGKISLDDLEKVIDIIVSQDKPTPPPKQILKGDVNGDGKVTQEDAKLINRYYAGDNVEINMDNADMNDDGKISLLDVSKVEDLANELDPKKFNINYSTGGHFGDVDGNGYIDMKDAILLRNYVNNNVNTDKEIFINYTDVNRDGKVDINDVNAITDLLRNVKTVQRELPVWSNVELTNQNGDIVRPGDNVLFLERENDSYKVQYTTASGEEKIGWVHRFVFDPIPQPDPTPYPYDGQYNGNAIWTYTDEKLTNHKGNDVITSGQIVTVLGETDDVYHIRYANVKGEVIERYLSKNSPTSYQQWTAKALVYKEAYGDDGQRRGNEAVYANDIVTVLNESVDAYQIEYSTDSGTKKIRWVTKTDIVPYEKIDTPPVPVPLKDMHITDAGISMIKSFEADNIYDYLTAYQNPGEEYLTIGYGHYGADVKPGMTITVEQAEAYLRQDLAKAEAAVKRNCGHLNLNQNQFDALVSFTFNCGEGNLQKLLYGPNGDEIRPLEELPEHMPFYRKGSGKILPGLVRRREAEVALFNTPV